MTKTQTQSKPEWCIPTWPETAGPRRYGLPTPDSTTVSAHLPLRGSTFEHGYMTLRVQYHGGENPTYSVEACLHQMYSVNVGELNRTFLPLLKKVDRAVCKAYKQVTGWEGGGFMQIPAANLRPFLLNFWVALGIKQAVEYRGIGSDDVFVDVGGWFLDQYEEAIRKVCERAEPLRIAA